MPRLITPSFIAELPLVVGRAQEAVLLARFEAGRRIFNATLGDALKRLDLMRESKAYQAARALPKGRTRTDAFKACNERFGFTEYALQAVATGHKNNGGFAERLGAHETQKIGSRVFAAVREYAFGKRGRPRFKGMGRPLHSLEGKSNAAGIRWNSDTGAVSWGKDLVLCTRLPTKAQDPYLHAGLLFATKYCRLVWRTEKGCRRWFVQLVQRGSAPPKYDFQAQDKVVGLDIGPSSVAIVAEGAVALERLAPGVDQPWAQMKRLQRAQDRSRRSMNPEHYNASGTVKAGPKRWARSSRYRARQIQLCELERRLSQTRRREHGELVNKILGLGWVIQTERLSYLAFQKSFGRSAKVRASGLFVQLLMRKAESAGASVVELDTGKLKMSQYDHVSGQYTGKPLSQRWHSLGGSATQVQRDCYSAFLAQNVVNNEHRPTRLQSSWAAAEPLLRRAGLCFDQSESGKPPGLPTAKGSPLPSDLIARQRRFVRGHARDVVAARQEPRNPTHTAFRTPCL